MATADTIRVIEYKPGISKFRITDPDHQFAGRSGTLEFTKNCRAWLLIDEQPVAVRLQYLEPIEGRRHDAA